MGLVLLGVAAGLSAETFRNASRIATSSDPVAIVVGDLNGDGRLDIVWGEGQGTTAIVHVLLAQANGTYLPMPPFTMPQNFFLEIRLADVNRDGKLDLITVSSFSTVASLAIFLGNGDGTFGSPTTIPLPNAGFNVFHPLLSPPLDLNGDGIPDFIVNSPLNGVAYPLLGDGAGGFSVKGTVQLNGFPTMADVNGDGKLDMLFPTGPSVSLGNGDGTFRGPYSYSIAGTSSGSCTYHDMDGDGHLDAVCGLTSTVSGDINGGTTLYIQHGNPDGTFNLSTIASQTFGDHTNQYNGEGTFEVPLAVADVNGDGLPDVIAYANDGISILLQARALSFANPTHYATGYASNTLTDYASVLVDLNGDGNLDVVNAGPNGIYVSYGSANGTLAAAPAFEVSPVIGYATVADFNGDGIPDVVASGYKDLEISLGVGDGTFKSYTPLPNNGIDFSTGQTATFAHILHGDFNGDGRQDILAIGSSSIYQYDDYILFNAGNGAFQPPVKVPNTSNVYPAYAALFDAVVYDVNQDGRSDILVSSTQTTTSLVPPTLAFMLSNGDGTFKTVSTTVPADVNQGYYSSSLPALADFNGDGRVDAVYGSLTHGYVVLGHGDGTFNTSGTTVTIPNPTNSSSVQTVATATGDFDGDGKQDFALLVQVVPADSSTTSAVWVYYGNGDGTFSSAVAAGTFNRAYTNLSVADLNRDGLADIVLKTDGSLAGGHVVGVVQSQSGRSFGPEVNYAAGTGLSSLAVADVNSDGLPDLVFANGDYNMRASSVAVLLNLGDVPAVTGTLSANPESSVAGAPLTLTAALSPPVGGTVLAGAVSFSVDGSPLGSAALSSNTAVIAGPTTLSVGSHQLSATWPGDSRFGPVTLMGTHMVTGFVTTTVIACPAGTVYLNHGLNPIITVSSAAGTPTGSIVLTDNGSNLANLTLINGTTGTVYLASVAGPHTLMATYVPTGSFAASSASCSFIIAADPTLSFLSVTPITAPQGAPIVLTANVMPSTATPGFAAPTGTVTFYNGSVAVGVAPLSAAASATLTVTNLPYGPDNISCTYSGDTVYAGSACNIVQVILTSASTTVTLSSSLDPAPALAAVTFTAHVTTGGGGVPPVGSAVSFSFNNQSIVLTTDANGNAAFTTNAPLPGSYPVTATFAATPFLQAGSAALTEVVTLNATTTTLTPAPNPAYVGQVVTLTATVASALLQPTGSVTFFDGGKALGTSTAASQSTTGPVTAVLTTSSLAVGTHPLSAVYAPGPAGANVLAGSSSLVVQEVVLPSGFSVALAPSTVSVSAGLSTTVAIQLTSLGGFSGPLNLTVGALPANATATIAPTSVTLAAGGTASSTLTLSTRRMAELAVPPKPGSSPRWPVVLAATALLLLPWSRKRSRLLRGSHLRGVVGVLSLWMLLQTLSGCTDSFAHVEVVSIGTYTVTVTATDANQNKQSAPLTLVITK